MECLLNQSLSCDLFGNYSYVAWIGAGILLSLIEMLVPGIFVIFFGLGAIFTGIIQYFFAFSLPTQFIIWVISSLGILFVGAKFLHDLFPSDKKFEPSTFKIVEGKIAQAIKNIQVGKKGGRIHFQGTDWDAISEDIEIPAGDYVKIISRDNITYRVVRPTQEEIEEFLLSKKKEEDE
jgi:membrane protein implicated in regulation of membrane protease activity